LHNRDTEESAPAEYPPEQPEADTLDDDGTAYGAEEAEMQAALEKELAETEAAAAAAAKQVTNGEDQEMAGTDEPAAKIRDDDEVSEAGSEDLEADSSGSDDEEDEEEGAEGGEGDVDEDMEMAEGDENKPAETVKTGDQKAMPQQGQPQVMVH
jgi:histone chaperone ASF1